MSVNYNPAIVTNRLTLYLDAGNRRSYPGSGNTWFDLSGNNNHGTLVNGPTFSSENGGGIVFDGTNDHVSFVSNPVFTNQMTIETWVNMTGVGPNQIGTLFSRETPGGGSYRMLYTSDSFNWICATSNNGWYTTGTSIIEPSSSRLLLFKQVVGVYDGSNLRLYVDGVLRIVGSNISGNVLTSGASYYLIRKEASNIDYGTGRIFAHRIYDRALTPTEILQNYNATRGRFGL
jgi:hypothetical protein